nr:hypothetical protein [Mycoplasmopsis bovis]
MLAVGLKGTTTGDTLIAEKAPEIVLERMVFPEPVISQALRTWIKRCYGKISVRLTKISSWRPYI